MTQAPQTPNSPNNENTLTSNGGLSDILFIVFMFIVGYLLTSLYTYHPNDPGILHNGRISEVLNNGGIAGALFADSFYYLLGYSAYLPPIIAAYIAWLIYQQACQTVFAKPYLVILPSIGFLLILVTNCGLLTMHLASANIPFPYNSGGELGLFVVKHIQSLFNQLASTILLVSLFLLGMVLLIHQSWLFLIYRAFINRNR